MPTSYGLFNLHYFYSQIQSVLDAADPRECLLWTDDLAADTQQIRWQEVRLAGRSRFLNMNGLSPSSAALGYSYVSYSPRVERVGSQTGEYPHLLHKTTEWMFNTLLTPLATSTTLGAATTYTSESQTIYVPETKERVFESVRFTVFVRSEFTASNSLTGVRLSFSLGGATSFSYDQLVTLAGTASRNISTEIDFDLTDYFNARFGSGASQTAQAVVSASTGTASSINGLCFKLTITYGFDPLAATTRIKTIRIPIHSQSTSLTNAQQEIGTDGVAPAPSGQIPALDTFLVEQSKTYRKIFLDLYANDGATTAGTNFTPQIQIDAVAEVARATVDTTIAPAMPWRDSYDISGITTNATHTFSMRCDTTVTGRLFCVGGFIVVNYEYDHAATVTNNLATYEAIVPLTQSAGYGEQELTPYDGLVSVNLPANYQRLLAIFDIHEPGTIILKQSGVFSVVSVSTASTAFTRRVGQQIVRSFTPLSSIGPMFLVQRVDTTAGWSIVRGTNRLTLDIWGNGRTAHNGAFAVINYTAGVRQDVDRGAHPVNFLQRVYDSNIVTSSIEVTRESGGQHLPTLGLPYRIIGAYIASHIFTSAAIAIGIALEQRDGEWEGDLGYSICIGTSPHVVSCGVNMLLPITIHITQDNLHNNKIDLTQRRRQIIASQNSTMAGWSTWITYHQHAFTVSGTVTLFGVPASDGDVVEIYAGNNSDPTTPVDLITRTIISGGSGGFTATVPDNIRTYFASYNNGVVSGRSLVGVPV